MLNAKDTSQGKMNCCTLTSCGVSFDISEFRGRRGTALFAFDVVVHDFQRSIPMALFISFSISARGREGLMLWSIPGFC